MTTIPVPLDNNEVQYVEIVHPKHEELYKDVLAEAKVYSNSEHGFKGFVQSYIKRHRIKSKIKKDLVDIFASSASYTIVQNIIDNFLEIGILIEVSEEEQMMEWFEKNRLCK